MPTTTTQPTPTTARELALVGAYLTTLRSMVQPQQWAALLDPNGELLLQDVLPDQGPLEVAAFVQVYGRECMEADNPVLDRMAAHVDALLPRSIF